MAFLKLYVNFFELKETHIGNSGKQIVPRTKGKTIALTMIQTGLLLQFEAKPFSQTFIDEYFPHQFLLFIFLNTSLTVYLSAQVIFAPDQGRMSPSMGLSVTVVIGYCFIIFAVN